MPWQGQSILGLYNWLLLPVCIAITILALAATGLSVDLASLLPTLGIAAVVASAYVFYASKRPDPVICGMLEAFLFLLVIGPPLGLMGYPLQALALPLWDREFAALDAALGFDWIAHLQWVSSSPAIESTLVYAYRSCMIQLACMVMLLSFARRFDRIREFLALFVVTALVVAFFSTLMPAEGAYPFHNPGDDILIWGDKRIGVIHLDHVRELRAGVFGSINLDQVEGLVTLPSFHAIFAILLAWSVRDYPVLFFPAAIWNLIVCVSAIAVGGHYMVDILAGAAIAAVAMYGYSAGWIVDRLDRALSDRRTMDQTLPVKPQPLT